jgi:hypothetical protein
MNGLPSLLFTFCGTAAAQSILAIARAVQTVVPKWALTLEGVTGRQKIWQAIAAAFC